MLDARAEPDEQLEYDGYKHAEGDNHKPRLREGYVEAFDVFAECRSHDSVV